MATNCKACKQGERDLNPPMSVWTMVGYAIGRLILDLIIGAVSAWAGVLMVRGIYPRVDYLSAWLTATSLLTIWRVVCFAYGSNVYNFDLDGEEHNHQRDPREEFLASGQYTWDRQWHPGLGTTPKPHTIRGPIVRLVRHGWLRRRVSRCQGPLYPDGSVRTDAAFTASSSLSRVRFIGYVTPRFCTVRQAASFVAKYGSPQEFYDNSVTARENLERLNHFAIVLYNYLTSSPDRAEQSAVGRFTREFLEATARTFGVNLRDAQSETIDQERERAERMYGSRAQLRPIR